jgi:hypothetical protein
MVALRIEHFDIRLETVSLQSQIWIAFLRGSLKDAPVFSAFLLTKTKGKSVLSKKDGM